MDSYADVFSSVVTVSVDAYEGATTKGTPQVAVLNGIRQIEGST